MTRRRQAYDLQARIIQSEANQLDMIRRALTRLSALVSQRITVAASDTPAAKKSQARFVCDGTEDEVEIQAAIDALPANGGLIELMEGTYSISDNNLSANLAAIEITSDNVIIRGEGIGVTIVQSDRLNHTEALIYVLLTTGARNILVEDLTFTNNGGNDTSIDEIVRADQNSENVVFNNIEITALDGDGAVGTLELNGIACAFIHSWMHDLSSNLTVQPTGINCRVSHNRFKDIGQADGDMLDIFGESSFITNNYVESTIVPLTGIAVGANGLSTLVLGNHIFGTQMTGPIFSNASGSVIMGNRVLPSRTITGVNSLQGIRVGGGGAMVVGNHVDFDNVASTNVNNKGIDCGVGAMIANNRIVGPVEIGIESSHQNPIVGNVIQRASNIAIQIRHIGGGFGAVVANNIINGWAFETNIGIECSTGDGANINSNQIGDCVVGIKLPTGGRVTVNANTFIDIQQQAIHVNGADHVSITGNVMKAIGVAAHNTYDAILVDNASFYGVISGNVIEDGGNANKARYFINVDSDVWAIGHNIADLSTLGTGVLNIAGSSGVYRWEGGGEIGFDSLSSDFTLSNSEQDIGLSVLVPAHSNWPRKIKVIAQLGFRGGAAGVDVKAHIKNSGGAYLTEAWDRVEVSGDIKTMHLEWRGVITGDLSYLVTALHDGTSGTHVVEANQYQSFIQVIDLGQE